jgi:tRNA(Ile)-lysidine synthetase-like protein
MEYFSYADILDEECFQKRDQSTDDTTAECKLKMLLSSHADKRKIAISLSGGVDSMVMLHILKRYCTHLEICAVHINYNNRDESIREANFLDEYCKREGVKMIRHDITHIKRFQQGMNRSVYEQQTKSIRYLLYARVVAEECVDGIYLAHHDGDIIENIFNNVMKNAHLNDLSVLKKQNIIGGVTILRPFLGVKKDVIMDYAVKYEVPYFKDTTPDWSCRGMMRNDIFPNCVKCYGNVFEDNLMRFSDEIKGMHDTMSLLMKTYMGYVVFRESVELNLILSEDVKSFPVTFWRIIFDNMCDELHMQRFSRKAIDNFYANLSSNNKTIMSKNTTIHKHSGKIYVFTGPCLV